MKITILALLLLALIPFCAFAVDGQMLINQSTVMAAGGFPYRITQPGSYKLSGNLVVTTAADGIDINSDDVSLDLNGFMISCTSSACNGLDAAVSRAFTGVVSFGFADITVKNGSVRGFGNGVYLFGSGLVSDLSATANVPPSTVHGAGITVFGDSASGMGFVVTRCAANSNQNGISSDNSVVTDSIANSNTSRGLTGSNSSFFNNVANFNQVGLILVNGVFGGNNFQNDGTPTSNGIGSVSQNNNNCGGSVC